MLRTIKLHGVLAKKYTKTVKVDGDNMFQVMRALFSIFGPQFKEDIRVGEWHVFDGKKEAGNSLGEEELNKKLTSKLLHIAPAVKGGSGAVRVLAGAVLIIAGFYFNQPWLVNIGASMVIGGVAEMLVKQPNANQPTQNQNDAGSYIYNGALNVTSQGGPIPLVYGRVGRASSVIITTDFSSDNIIS